MKSITPQIFSMQRTWRKIDGIKTGLWQVYLATLKLTRTPLTQPNLMVPPLASFAAKAAASSAADGSSPLARPSSNSSCQPVAAIMEEKAPTGEQWRLLSKVKLKKINLEFYKTCFQKRNSPQLIWVFWSDLLDMTLCLLKEIAKEMCLYENVTSNGTVMFASSSRTTELEALMSHAWH